MSSFGGGSPSHTVDTLSDGFDSADGSGDERRREGFSALTNYLNAANSSSNSSSTRRGPVTSAREDLPSHSSETSSNAMTHAASSDSLSMSEYSATEALYAAEAGNSSEGGGGGGARRDGSSLHNNNDGKTYAFEVGDHEGSSRNQSSKGKVVSTKELTWFDRLSTLPYMNRRRAALTLVLLPMLLAIIIVICAVSAHKNQEEDFNIYQGPPMGVAGQYRNVFTEFLGVSEEEVDAKLNTVWQKLFYGDPNTESVYVELEPDMAQIINTESNVVTSEGISYGMMSCVHLERQLQFNKLWNWARFHMQHEEGDFESFFAWRVTRDGQLIDAKDVIPAPDAEAYIATALIAAHRKWGSTEEYPYKTEAMRLLENMGNPKFGFFTKDGKVTFNPTDWGASHSNPSYHLPAFYETWARFLYNEGSENFNFWNQAAKQSRDFFHKAANVRTGLFPDYTTIDGKPLNDKNLQGHQNFQWDAWRAHANVAVDWAWWNQDKWQQEYSDRVLTFFYKQGVGKYDSQFTVDGKVTKDSPGHDGGLVSMNAVTTLGARKQTLQNAFVKELWDQPLPEGPTRYYPAMLYMMGLLHCSGRFKAYF